MSIGRRAGVEFVGTFWLVFGGCGSAVIAAAFPNVGIGLLGVALAFGLTVLTMAYAIGHISGCHLNPAVSIGLVVGGRFKAKDLVPYIIAQLLGGVIPPLAWLSIDAIRRQLLRARATWITDRELRNVVEGMKYHPHRRLFLPA